MELPRFHLRQLRATKVEDLNSSKGLSELAKPRSHRFARRMVPRVWPGFFAGGFVLAMLLGNLGLTATAQEAAAKHGSLAYSPTQSELLVAQQGGSEQWGSKQWNSEALDAEAEPLLVSEAQPRLIGQTASRPNSRPAGRTKSAVAPPASELPSSGSRLTLPDQKPARPAAITPHFPDSSVEASQQIISIPVQATAKATKARIVGQPAQAPPADAEYLPDDFFEQLQDNPTGLPSWARETASRDSDRPEIRGVWMTTSDMAVLRDQQSLRRALEQLARLNFNTIYPVVWTRGYVTYTSEVAKAAGIPQLSRGLQDQDLLTDLTEQAHALGLSVIPWFEYGFMVPPQSEVALLHPDWLTEQRNGNRTKLNSGKAMAWLNPFKPEVQRLLQDLAVDLVNHYDVDGIQFDDHMSLPKAFGYDSWTSARYQTETGHQPPRFATNKAWTQWRADRITYAMANLYRAVKSIQPGLVFSISPNRYDFAYRHHLQDWKAWLDRGIIDELIVQAYRRNQRDFVADLRQPEIRQAKAQIPTGIGILTGLSDRRIGMYQIKQQVRAAQSEGLGVSFFFYQSLWDNAPESVAERKSGFRSIFPQAVPRIARL